MIKDIGKRKSGKTTRLIYKSAVTQKHIMVPNKARAKMTEALIKDLGIQNVPEVLSYTSWLGGHYLGSEVAYDVRKNGILIDEALDCLDLAMRSQGLEIDTATVSYDMN